MSKYNLLITLGLQVNMVGRVCLALLYLAQPVILAKARMSCNNLDLLYLYL
jgi:hypothetical protein